VLRSDVGDAHRLSLSDALSISENRSSQGETTVKEALLAPVELACLAPSLRLADMGTGTRSTSPKSIYTRMKYTFITTAKAFFPVRAAM
jgi:hypothetical protein